MTTVDGQEMIDFVESWGPMLLGHSHPEVTKAVVEAAGKGHQLRRSLSRRGRACPHGRGRVPGMDMVRMVNFQHGGDHVALRLARGVTGRTKVLKFIGCYHGHADPFLASAGSGVATLFHPGTPEVPETVRDTLLAPFTMTCGPSRTFSTCTARTSRRSSWSPLPETWASCAEEGFLKALPGPVRHARRAAHHG